MKLYGLKLSYFAGKLEGYLRYKKIPYEFRARELIQCRKSFASTKTSFRVRPRRAT